MSTGRGRNQGKDGLAILKNSHLCFFVYSGKRIVSSPGRKTRCDLCKQMIPENTYASHMVSGNDPLSNCARSQFVFQRAGPTADSRYTSQITVIKGSDVCYFIYLVWFVPRFPLGRFVELAFILPNPSKSSSDNSPCL